MKAAAKVFIIISLVCEFWLIIPLIVGLIALNRIDKVKYKDDLTEIAILTIIFCSLLGGILMLCIPDSEFKGDAKAYNDGQKSGDGKMSDAAENLAQLKKLLDDGIITQDVYEEKSQKYLEDI